VNSNNISIVLFVKLARGPHWNFCGLRVAHHYII